MVLELAQGHNYRRLRLVNIEGFSNGAFIAGKPSPGRANVLLPQILDPLAAVYENEESMAAMGSWLTPTGEHGELQMCHTYFCQGSGRIWSFMQEPEHPATFALRGPRVQLTQDDLVVGRAAQELENL